MAKETLSTPVPDEEPQGKGHPTPRRRDREAELKRPLVSNNRKEARAKLNKERERARLGLAAGEERYLPQRDKGPQRKWVRDYVDARWNFGEFLIPIMFAVIIATFLPSQEAQLIAILALWAFFGLTILDAIYRRHQGQTRPWHQVWRGEGRKWCAVVCRDAVTANARPAPSEGSS